MKGSFQPKEVTTYRWVEIQCCELNGRAYHSDMVHMKGGLDSKVVIQSIIGLGTSQSQSRPTVLLCGFVLRKLCMQPKLAFNSHSEVCKFPAWASTSAIDVCQCKEFCGERV